MNQNLKKILIAVMAIIISMVFLITVSYAWITLSSSTEAKGIQISIGGGGTILLAPDTVKTVDGKTYHYPGNFNDTLIFSRFDTYDYLKELDALKPVSTADGLNWFVPAYYNIADEEVKNSTAHVGQIKDISQFTKDSELLNANLKDSNDAEGHYIYLDFWVVSPKSAYTLRVSQGDENGGSYLIELPKIQKDENGFYLQKTNGAFSASARIGFLVNTNYLNYENYIEYQNSRYFNSNYKTLAGAYQEKGNYVYSGNYRFHIYEPNGDFNFGSESGRYVITKPIGIVNDALNLVDIQDRLAVQLKSSWIEKDDCFLLDQIFNSYVAGKNIKGAHDAEFAFYNNYLQGQFLPYISQGHFIKNTSELYNKCVDETGCINATDLASLRTSGATEDTYIVKLIPNIPQRIRMFVWIEGQDIDCTQSLEDVNFALSIELAGGNR